MISLRAPVMSVPTNLPRGSLMHAFGEMRKENRAG